MHHAHLPRLQAAATGVHADMAPGNTSIAACAVSAWPIALVTSCTVAVTGQRAVRAVFAQSPAGAPSPGRAGAAAPTKARAPPRWPNQWLGGAMVAVRSRSAERSGACCKRRPDQAPEVLALTSQEI
jgi:hypothetical protein